MEQFKCEIELTGSNEGVKEELEGGGVDDDAILLHEAEERGDVGEAACAGEGLEELRISARRVFVVGSERGPVEKIDFD